MCRWFQLFVKMVRFTRDWTSAVVVLARVCAQEDWFKHAAFLASVESAEAVPLAADTPGIADKKTSTKKSVAQEIKSLRAACSNALHFAFRSLGCSERRRMGQLLSNLTAETQRWYHEQATTLNCAKINGKLCVGSAHGCIMDPHCCKLARLCTFRAL